MVAGRTIAGRLVRLACQRHLRDLDLGAERGLIWSPEHAQFAIDFFPACFVLPDGDHAGQPFVLAPPWEFVVGSLHGWFERDGFRRFKQAYVETGKGSAKTPVGAGLCHLAMVGDAVEGAQCFVAARTREQAHTPFRDCKRILGPDLRARLEILEHNIAMTARGSYIRPVSSEAQSLEGHRVYFALLDELGLHRDGEVVEAMRRGTKGNRNALLFAITNSGDDRDSICWEFHDKSRKVLEGVLQDDEWFAYVCQLDACEPHRAEGLETPVEGCPKCDDWRDERVWPKTNPLLGVTIPYSYLRKEVKNAIDMPSSQNKVRRFNFCGWLQSEVRWMPAEVWARAGVPNFYRSPDALMAYREILRGRPCIAGLDLATTNDLAACVLVFPDEDFFLEPAVPGESEADVRGGLDVLAYFWCPDDRIRERSARDQVLYNLWRDRGFIEATPGNVIDYRYIRRRINELRDGGFNILEVCYDPAFATQLALQLQDEDGFVVVPVAQSFSSINEPTVLVEKLALGANLRHGGHPVLAWCAANAVVEMDSGGRRHLSKTKSPEKIDGVAALITACKRIGVARGPVRGSLSSQTLIGPPRTTSGMYS